MGTILVVPVKKKQELPEEGVAKRRHQESPRALGLQRPEEPLDDGDAAVLTDCSDSRMDFLPSAACEEARAAELSPWSQMTYFGAARAVSMARPRTCHSFINHSAADASF